jgi:hypothetical protein
MDDRDFSLVVCITFMVFCGIFLPTLIHTLPKHNWHCTQQQRVGDTLPAAYECTQYTKGDK